LIPRLVKIPISIFVVFHAISFVRTFGQAALLMLAKKQKRQIEAYQNATLWLTNYKFYQSDLMFWIIQVLQSQ
jgi:hypothetical protein